jgi:hypothetical protein
MSSTSIPLQGYKDPRSLEEAETRQAEARLAVASIEHQLREKEHDVSSICCEWRKKAKWALWCKKEQLVRLATWVRQHNRLVDLTLNGKEKLPDIDLRDPNRLLLHTYNLARTLAGRQTAMNQFLRQEEREVLNAVRSYYLLYPELIPDSKRP